jgi:hypothetical protein
MVNVAPLTKTEVKQVAIDWYRKLDVHAPMVELLPMLADDGLEMHWPEGATYGHVEFEGWYQRVIRTFFDEVHELKEFNAEISGDRADIKLVVKWEASIWNPPAANSQRIVLAAAQTWVVKRSPETQRPIIVTYVVDSLDYYEGSAKL